MKGVIYARYSSDNQREESIEAEFHFPEVSNRTTVPNHTEAFEVLFCLTLPHCLFPKAIFGFYLEVPQSCHYQDMLSIASYQAYQLLHCF